MLPDALRWRAEGPPAPLLRGDELARELGIATGPRVGELLGELSEAQYAGEVPRASRPSRTPARWLSSPRAAMRIGLRAMRDPDCIFCKIVAGELPATIVGEDERTISFMDIAPATRGHALVIPRAHSRRPAGASSADDLAAVGARRQAAGRARRSSGSAPTA